MELNLMKYLVVQLMMDNGSRTSEMGRAQSMLKEDSKYMKEIGKVISGKAKDCIMFLI